MVEAFPATVLVIDDSPINLKILERILQKAGWTVVLAASGEAGIALAIAKVPDLILLDVLMPGLDGFATCEQLKHRPETAAIPVIFVSALTETDNRVKGFAVGGVDYIPKPWDERELISRLTLHLQLQRSHQDILAKNQALTATLAQLEATQQQLKQSEANFWVTFDHSPDYIVIYEAATGRIQRGNRKLRQLTGLSQEQLEGHTILDLPCWIGALAVGLEQGPDGTPSCPLGHCCKNMEVKVQDPDGQTLTLLLSGEAIAFNECNCCLLVMRDITDRQVLQTQLNILSQACEQSPASIVITDTQGKIRYVNPKFESLSGYRAEEVLGQNPRILKSGDKTPYDYRKMWQTLASGQEWRGEFHNRKKNGELYWERASISPIVNDEGKITHYVAVKEDITLEKKQAEALYHQAHFDSLTGLPNRLLAKDRLQQAIESGIRNHHMVGVMFIDLDNFKTVNDTLGHEAGDRLLQEVAQRLQRALRQTDTVARLGGDEFLVIVSHLHQIRRLTAIAQRILGVLRQPIYLQGHEVFVQGSIGITVFPDDGLQADILLRNADTAMYAAKMEGRNLFRFFTPHMNIVAQRRLELESELRQGLKRREFTVSYQPIVALASGSIVGAEALMRWHNPQLDTVDPSQFIPVAEEMGLIVELGEWFLEQVCRQMARWQMQTWVTDPQGANPQGAFGVSINISPRQLQDNYFFTILQNLILNHQLSPQLLTLEITEYLMLNENVEISHNLQKLYDYGVCLALDDFGTGYGSLNYLRQFKFNCLKIDASFVQTLDSDCHNQNLVKGIIAMAHHLNLTVIAEGIETPQQWAFLREQHCDYGQGYLFQAAIAPDTFLALWQHQPFEAVAFNEEDQHPENQWDPETQTPRQSTQR